MKLFGASIPNLAKFCPPEFNIKKGCNTIRLGTLYDYREEENEKLRDEGEGTFEYSVKFPKLTEVSIDWISAFEIEGESRAKIDRLEFNDGKIKTTGMSLSGSTHNCWVYCISKNTKSAGNITDTHDDSWTIPLDKLNTFAHYVCSILAENIKSEDIPDHINKKYSLAEIQQKLSVTFEIREIDYTNRSIEINSEEEFPISDILKTKDSVAFIKPSIFKYEEEVRIAFWLVFEGNKISIENKTKILNLRPIDSII